MGLAEKRRLAGIKDQSNAYATELEAAVGFKLPFEINAETFPESAVILDCYDSYRDSYGPGLVVKVMKTLCGDSFGKEAVQGKIKRIVFENTAKSPEEKGMKEIKLNGDTLLVRESFYGYSDILYGEDGMKTEIENLL
jgi:hypothetical protein